MRNLPFTISNINGRPTVEMDVAGSSQNFTPEEISAVIIRKMKGIAEDYLEKPVTHAIITVPGYFNDSQRQATEDAGTMAGLNIIRTIAEPRAAAIAYGLAGNIEDRLILVYHLGGATFDVSLLSVEIGVMDILATISNIHLGGEDFNHRVMNYFAELYNERNNVDITRAPETMDKLKHAVEKAKRTLSTQASARIEIEAFHEGKPFTETLTRARFEELNMDLFKETLRSVKQVLQGANVTKSDVSDIVLVGGSTYIPSIQALLQDFFDGKEVHQGINPDEVVVSGAALHAGFLSDEYYNNMICVLDINPLALGIEITGGVMAKVIPGGSSVPASETGIFSTSADNQDSVLIKVCIYVPFVMHLSKRG